MQNAYDELRIHYLIGSLKRKGGSVRVNFLHLHSKSKDMEHLCRLSNISNTLLQHY